VIPLRDANPTRRAPVVTLGLIFLCVVVFGWELLVTASGGDAALDAFFQTWGAIPSRISAAFAGTGDPGRAAVGLVAGLFLHAGWLHLAGNMLFLWIFGNNVEDRLGRLPFLGFYVAAGIAASLAQAWADPTSPLPLVGASGAIAATLGAYLVLWPRARVLSLVFLGFFYQLVEVPAVILLGLWFLFQLIDSLGSLGGTAAGGGVAFFAHIGGFAIGAAVGLLARARGPGGSRRAAWREQA
jgi:membrane associated rhomboid family serine protease